MAAPEWSTGMDHYRGNSEVAFQHADRIGESPRIDRVVLSSGTPPHSLADATRYAENITMVGGTQRKRSIALAETVFPHVEAGQSAFAVDMTGVHETDTLNHRAHKAGIPMFHWKVSPSGLIAATKERVHAATILVDAMAVDNPREQPDREAKITTVLDVFDALHDDEHPHPSLGQFNNAIHAASQHDERRQDPNFKLTDEQTERVMDLFSTTDARETDLRLARDVQRQVRLLLAGETIHDPVLYNTENPADPILFSYVYPRGNSDSVPTRKLLAHYIRTTLAAPSAASHGQPNHIAFAGVEHIDTATANDLDETLERNGTRKVMSFAGVNETTTSMVGRKTGMVVSLGGLTGREAEEVADALGKDFKTEQTGSSKHQSRNAAPSESGGVSVGGSEDITSSREIRHMVYPHQLTKVGETDALVTQSGITHTVRLEHPPYAATFVPSRDAREMDTHITSIHPVPATPQPLIVDRVVRSISERLHGRRNGNGKTQENGNLDSE